MKYPVLSEWLRKNVAVWESITSSGGFPEFLVFDHPPVDDDPEKCECRGGYMVHRNTGKVGAAVIIGRGDILQTGWADLLCARGWVVDVCLSENDAIRFLQDVGYGKK